MNTEPSGVWPPIKIGDLVETFNRETGNKYLSFCSKFDPFDNSFWLVYMDDGQALEYFMDDVIEGKDGSLRTDDGRLDFRLISSAYEDSAG